MSGFYYEGNVAPSILRLCSRDDAVIAVQSFSKSYCMTGWRLGWVVARRDLVQKATQLNEFIVSHAASMIQKAGEVALRQGEDEVAALLEQLHERRDFAARCTVIGGTHSTAQATRRILSLPTD